MTNTSQRLRGLRITKSKIDYPMGTVSHATMRAEDLIPAFCGELEDRARLKTSASGVSFAERKSHRALVRQIRRAARSKGYYDGADSGDDLSALFDALEAYAGPYMYFGAHPGDGSDFGYWLSESWDEDFGDAGDDADAIKVSDIGELPRGFKGEVAVVTDHGNVTLYSCDARTLREIWAIV
jgi:hypothetical protein